MKRVSVCCFTGKAVHKPNPKHQNPDPPPPPLIRVKRSEEIFMENPPTKSESVIAEERSVEIMENPPTITENSNADEVMKPNMIDSSDSHSDFPVANIIANHDFSNGLDCSWHPNFCNLFIVSADSGFHGVMPTKSGGNIAVVGNRTESWQGLEQDITRKISPNVTYSVSAVVGVSGPITGPADVLATLKLESYGSTNYSFIKRISVTKGKWKKLEGTFSLSTIPQRVVFYLEGPSPGVNILIDSVKIMQSDLAELESEVDITEDFATATENGNAEEVMEPKDTSAVNILLNHDFSNGLDSSWHPNCCNLIISDSGFHDLAPTKPGGKCAIVANRTEPWQGLEQDITTKISPNSAYSVSAFVGVSGPVNEPVDVLATLKLVSSGSIDYSFIGRTCVTKGKWGKLEGTFSLSTIPERVIFYLEGPSPGVNILIDSVEIIRSKLVEPESTNTSTVCVPAGDENIILNPSFEDGLNNWSGRGGCKIVLHDSMADGKIVPQSGKVFAAATERTQSWNGIQQEVSGRLQRKLAYEATALVRIYGNNVTNATVQATLWVQTPEGREQYIVIANVQATDKDWVQLKGKFLLNGTASKVVIYLEGPPPGTDILLNSFVIKQAEKIPPSPPPVIEDPAYGVNIVANSELSDGTNGFFTLGNCNMSVATGSPRILPSMARDTLGIHEPLSGRYIIVTSRTQNWMGPAQMITDKLKLFLTYQVSAWVRIGFGASGPQNVNVALSVDNQWVNGGQVEISDGRWHEIAGSFRIEKQPSKVMVYVQGPGSGVDLMLAGLQIFPVDHGARFRHLRRQTDKIRKRDVTLKFSGVDPSSLFGTFVRVRQTQNSFPIGSCMSRTNIDNEDFNDFFVKNFNWAVFGNELKWYWTEPQRGNFNYKDADEMVSFCQTHNIEARGHCIFWEVDGVVQQWIKSLNQTDLMTAVQNRLNGLLTRYKGKFKHYDVNNEMMHGSFYQDHLGKDIRANMFKTAHQLDPPATLFVNDYHVEDGCDTRSNPEKYIDHILGLQQQGAPVGGIGIQGHIDSPVGAIVCSALDKLGILGLPIWFTELDVSSINECVRGDDLEVMLREAFAHPAVEGIMLWGFWELFMSRNDSHLVNAEGEVNEAGKRLLGLKQEWMTHSHGHIDDQGMFQFRGFHGTYEVEVISGSKRVVKTFVVDKDDSPMVLSIDV